MYLIERKKEKRNKDFFFFNLSIFFINIISFDFHFRYLSNFSHRGFYLFIHDYYVFD
jgi:hypothetical protein